MAKLSDVTVEVNARLGVDRRTAETCLRLVEVFCNDSGMCIMCSNGLNGEVKFEFAHKSSPGVSREALNAINAIGREAHKEE